MFYPPNLDLENAPALDVLAIAAHPDDIEQTCGGALLKMGEMGYITGALDLTAGEMGTRGTPEQRMAEAVARHPSCGWHGGKIYRCQTRGWRTTWRSVSR